MVQQWHWRSINSAFQQDVARLYERAAVFLQSLFDIEIELSKIFESLQRCSHFERSVNFVVVHWLQWQHGVYTTAKSDEMIAHLKLALRENRLQLRVPKMNSSMNSSIRWRQQDMLLMALVFSICFVFKCSCISIYIFPIYTWCDYYWMITVWWFLQLVVSSEPWVETVSPWTMATKWAQQRPAFVCFYYRPYIYIYLYIWRITTLPFRGFRVYIYIYNLII